MIFFKLISYIIFAYGFCELMVFFDGPFNIIEKFRRFAHWISDSFGKLFTCVACLSTWTGLVFSAINYFFIPISFTPFNIIFEGTDLWWLIIFMDAMFTCGTTWSLYQLEEMIERLDNNKENLD